MKVVLKFSPIARRNRYGGVRRMLKTLERDLASVTTWSTMDTELHDETAEVNDRTPRVHKLAHYLSIHEFTAIRNGPVRMLEIGSFYGDSLQTWQKYLHPESLIVGIDIDSKLVKIADSGGSHIRIGGEGSVSFLADIAAEFGPFDVIIDAGSQTSSRMIDSFDSLFENALRGSGIYIMGDVYCDFWTLYNSFSFADILSAFVDAVRGHHRVASDIARFRSGHLVVVRRA